jgi:hypothetical protein
MLRLKEDEIYSLQEKVKCNVREKTEILQKDISRTLHSEDKNIKSDELLVFTTEVKKKTNGNPTYSFHE